MKKLNIAIKFELIQLFRQKILYIILPIVMFFLFTSTQRGLHEITLSAYVVQTLIFGFLFIGYQTGIRDKKYGYDQLIKKMKNSFSEDFAKVLAIWIYCVFINIVLIIEIIILGHLHNSIPWLVRESVSYILLYFLLTSMISSVIGLLIGEIISKKSGYFFLLIIGAFIGPLGVNIIQQIFAILNINPMKLKAFFVWINLGQYAPDMGINLQYGLEIESKRFIHHIVFLFIVVGLYFVLLCFRKFERPEHKKLSIKASAISIVLIIISVIIYNQSIFIYKAGSTDNHGKDVEDFIYYDNKKKVYEEIADYEIKSIQGKLDLRKHLVFSGNIGIETKKPIDKITMSLYHGFIIKNITANGKACSWKQNGDICTINLKETYSENSPIQLHMEYEGMSSQYFFAGQKATLLTNYFAFLPFQGKAKVMLVENSSLNTIPLKNNKKIDYQLEILNNKKIYSNLSNTNKDIYEGDTTDGVIILSGHINELQKDFLQIIYTDDVDPNSVASFAEKISAQQQLLANLLDLKVENISTICCIPIKSEQLGNYSTNSIQSGSILYTSLTPTNYLDEQTILDEALASILLGNHKFVLLSEDEKVKYSEALLSWYMEEYNIDGESFFREDILSMNHNDKKQLVEELKNKLKD